MIVYYGETDFMEDNEVMRLKEIEIMRFKEKRKVAED